MLSPIPRAIANTEARLRVALLVGGFPDRNRLDRSIFNLRAAHALNELVDLDVIVLRAWKPGRPLLEHETLEGLRVQRASIPLLPGRDGWNLQIARWVLPRLLAPVLRRIDVLHSVSAYLAGVVASQLNRHDRFLHVCQVIGSDINTVIPALGGLRALRGWEKHVGGVLCNSDALIAQWQLLYGERVPCRRIYRGTDLARFGRDRIPAPGLVRFLYLGGLPVSPRNSGFGLDGKGGITVQRAWSQLEQHPNAAGARLIFAGPFADQEATYRWHESLRHPGRVTIRGVVAPDEVPRLLEITDAVLLPSRAEGLPNVAVEAAAAGVAVIGSCVGGVPEVVVERETGLLLQPADPDIWAAALRSVLEEPDQLIDWGRQARERARRQFDSRSYGAALQVYYRELLAPEGNLLTR